MNPSNDSFTTLCFYCRAPYDAMPAPFCGCTTDTPTLVCPTCERCFCDAPEGFKQSFWVTAPEPVWNRRPERIDRAPR